MPYSSSESLRCLLLTRWAGDCLPAGKETGFGSGSSSCSFFGEVSWPWASSVVGGGITALVSVEMAELSLSSRSG